MFKEGSGWAEGRAAAYDSTAKVVIQNEDPDRFRLLLDWAYPFKKRCLDASTVQQILSLSDRYLGEHFNAMAIEASWNLSPTIGLMVVALKHRLDVNLYRKMIVCAVKQPDLITDKRSKTRNLNCH